MAGVGKRISSLDGETRQAFRQSAVDRQRRCGIWTEYTASLSWTSHGAHAALHARDHARNLRRLAFDFVHEDRLEPERIARYRALVLPNVAMLSDKQCRQLRDYVDAGGSLMGSFETSLYDENLKPRADFGLGDVFGISKAGDAVGTNGNPYYAWIEQENASRAHAILAGFADTRWLPGAENRVPLNPIADPLLTVVPGFVR